MIINITNLLLKLLIENGQNVQFLSQLQDLSLIEIEIDDIEIDSATTWLKAVAKYATKITLESQINSLQGVRIDSCAFNEEFVVLKNCKKLEMLRIRNCDQELSKLSKILDLKVSNKISTLEVIQFQIYAQTIVLTLEKSGTLLQRLSLELNGDESQEYTLLLEALKSFCPNIIYLDIANIKILTKL
ncbi:hypothetical protein C2G38_2158948 [Gigaspora rosea]|uniref:Uncharacterized protein n=1 Tax=Gigaspora rosea TaxID=44941 RepID=A0A397VZY3_9GLOM|nr:hypothetical protein C2G38_2158948 [Gigaspora rosea]